VLSDEHLLWKKDAIECVMISCCAGAELQLRRVRTGVAATHATSAGSADFEIVLRELYPTKSDLYERSRALALEY
jgi:hypothetical protein